MAGFIVTVTCATAAVMGTAQCPLSEPHTRQVVTPEQQTCTSLVANAESLIKQFGFEPKNFKVGCRQL